MLLCSSCQKQPSCLPAQLAQSDRTLATMLEHLQDCAVKTPAARPAWLLALQRSWDGLWANVKHWGRRWHIGAT